MTKRPSVPAVPTPGRRHTTAVDVITDDTTQEAEIVAAPVAGHVYHQRDGWGPVVEATNKLAASIRGRIDRLDKGTPFVPEKPPSLAGEAPYYERLNAEWLTLVGYTFAEAGRILHAKRLQHCATGTCR